jgi:hypothetical protein
MMTIINDGLYININKKYMIITNLSRHLWIFSVYVMLYPLFISDIEEELICL